MLCARRSRTVRGPWFFLFRAFFPNWQFYHQVGPVPHLYVRHQIPDAAWSDWWWVYPRRSRSIWNLFHNPWGNLALAEQNLVDHLAHDLNHLPAQFDARDLVAYRLVQALAREACWHQLGAQAGQVFEFEIRLERSDTLGVVSSHTLMQAPAAVV